ncbi:DoxX family protein [Flavobacterium sp. '19STA2R22 D10 B1']|uniref:DoxX family protein n=1 Tax=Flavobacterium aerium TaxID=3037261 RepID=UPI00278C49FF|nr:DoxX family protein [Flavobacterium sp. '19STA2R22 D10 B1']
MKYFLNVTHWAAYIYYVYIFGYAGLYKIFLLPKMVKSMESLGFNKTWTIWIGIAEVLGLIIVLLGLYDSRLKNLGLLLLFPFAVGAFTTHMAHQEYHHYFNSLMVCILTIFLLLTDKNFKIHL